MTATDTLAALCAALDAGDDSVLPVLADALDDADDPAAGGLRRVGARRPRHWTSLGQQEYHWYSDRRGEGSADEVAHETFVLLLPPGERDGASYTKAGYPTRSAALLALAVALAEP
jgi:hypothetical protein